MADLLTAPTLTISHKDVVSLIYSPLLFEYIFYAVNGSRAE